MFESAMTSRDAAQLDGIIGTKVLIEATVVDLNRNFHSKKPVAIIVELSDLDDNLIIDPDTYVLVLRKD